MKKLLTLLAGLCLYLSFLPSVFATLDNGLIGYWPLNGDALDHSGKGNHGTVLTGASFVANPTGEGFVLQNAIGNVNEGYVQVALPSSYHPGHQIVGYKGSGAFWVMFDDRESMRIDEGWQGLLGTPPAMLYVARELLSDNDRIRSMIQRTENAGSNKNFWPRAPVGSVSEQERWYHVAWTFFSHNKGEEGHFRWYIDGILVYEYTDGLQTNSSYGLRIGAGQQGYASNTKMAEMRLYDRILTAEEVLELSRQKHFSPVGHYPAWWWDYSLVADKAQADDYTVVNQGQLKYVASQTASYLQSVLEPLGGIGEDIQVLVEGWSTPSTGTDDYAAINTGQLKYVASLFYDRLHAVTFDDWPESFQIDPTTNYPWPAPNAEAPVDEYVLANAGQLKYLFSFDLSKFDVFSVDSDGNGLPDWWELKHFGEIGIDTITDSDNDRLPDWWELFHFGNLDQGGDDSFLNDGISNKEKYQCNINPTINESQSSELRTEYSYDAIGRLINVNSTSMTLTITLDSEGNILSVQ